MGMFDSIYDDKGLEHQTKAFECLLIRYEIGDRVKFPLRNFQVDVLGDGNGEVFATIRDGVIQEITHTRDVTLTRVDYYGNPVEDGTHARDTEWRPDPATLRWAATETNRASREHPAPFAVWAECSDWLREEADIQEKKWT